MNLTHQFPFFPDYRAQFTVEYKHSSNSPKHLLQTISSISRNLSVIGGSGFRSIFLKSSGQSFLECPSRLQMLHTIVGGLGVEEGRERRKKVHKHSFISNSSRALTLPCKSCNQEQLTYEQRQSPHLSTGCV